MQGDVVEVHVNRLTKTITYSVNEVLQASHSHDMLVDDSRVFMPYVEMFFANNAVEWLLL